MNKLLHLFRDKLRVQFQVQSIPLGKCTVIPSSAYEVYTDDA